eukprot:TRINITY_DN7754_c0_g1_i1.p1 TRINITY_DN7754_c0_g1~~TRINITY_DN7754_c0_g1_i1.p1  ORF type:complete len:529 (+),score=129.69 TRINITY_DN7754_c0_g1_i1:157-1743(+)
MGVRKGDPVCIYMPNAPEAIYAALACARIGAIHSIIFAGFSAEAIANRVQDCQARVLITSTSAVRGGKHVPLKQTVDEALVSCPGVEHVIVCRSKPEEDTKLGEKQVWMHDIMAAQRPYCPPEMMDSEDPLFFLYTSGSTGKPKGVVHTTAGYLLMTILTYKYIFDAREDDVHGCMADIGWITGHSYMMYGPLASGATTFMFESTPLFPDPSRYWAIVEQHKITTFYTAPTAIRALMKFGDEPVKKHDRSSLRVIGSVGEPINPEAWKWYFEVVGEGRCALVDTYWQTETGGIILAPLPGVTPLKPGSATLPFFGIDLSVLHAKTGKVLEGNGVEGVLAVNAPWPSITRSVWGDHARYMQTYLTPYPGRYFTGDSVKRDEDGYYWIGGRVDDVINVSGHRIGTAELESALVGHGGCAEAAVVGYPHPVKGQGIVAYCIMKEGVLTGSNEPEIETQLRLAVRKHIGPFASPDIIVITHGLPKTRSGKIMRRILRKIAAQETDSMGDTTTLAEPEIVNFLIEKFDKKKTK